MTHNGTPHTNASSTHHPDMPPSSGPEPSHTTGRAPNGRFAKGNPGGPGNPFARKVAAFRQEFMAAVTGDDIAVIVRALIDKAKAGDVAAARLVLQYTLGKPAAAVDPDRLDEMEWEQWQRDQAAADSDTVWMGMHASTANTIARTIIPVMQKEHFAELHRQLHQREEDRREEAAEDEREEQRRAERKASRERQTKPAESAPAAAPRAPAAPPPPEAKPPMANGGNPGAATSPIKMPNGEHDGQEASEQTCAAAAMKALRLIGVTVNKREETARRAANDVSG